MVAMARGWVLRSTALAIAALLVISAFGQVMAQDSMAHVRVMHLSPDAPAVDVYVDGDMAVENLAFPNATDYLELPTGEHRVQVVPTGAGTDQAVIDATLTLDATNYSVAAIGMLDSIQPLVLQDDSGEPAEGMAHIRVAHAVPDAPAVDIAVAGGPVLVEDLAFGEATDYMPVDAGSYDLEIRAAGTDQVVLSIPSVTLEAGQVYSVAAVGEGVDSIQAEVFTDRVVMLAATGTGGGTPTMPNTGFGGTATETSSISWPLIGTLAAIGLLAVGGTVRLATRKVRI